MKALKTNVSKSSDLPKAVYKLMFNSTSFNYKGKKVKPKIVTLRSPKGKVIKKVQIGDYVYLQQNPYKNSSYGQRARNGENIMWIIHQPTGRYIGRVIDGQPKKLN